MSVNVRQHPRGGWDVDINVLLATGDRHRERRKLSASYSKTTAREWAERRERELLLTGPKVRKVPTLEAFASRFIDGYARANRQKPSGVAAKESQRAVEAGGRVGCAGQDALLDSTRAGSAKPTRRSMTFDDYERLLKAAQTIDARSYLIAFSEARLGCARARSSHSNGPTSISNDGRFGSGTRTGAAN